MLPAVPELINSLTLSIAQWSSVSMMSVLSKHAGVEIDGGAFAACQTIHVTGRPQRPSTLARMLQTSDSNVSKISGRLVAAGLAEITTDPTDGRARLLGLTPAGHDLVERLLKSESMFVATAVAHWPEKEVVEFARLMTRFAQSVAAFNVADVLEA